MCVCRGEVREGYWHLSKQEPEKLLESCNVQNIPSGRNHTAKNVSSIAIENLWPLLAMPVMAEAGSPPSESQGSVGLGGQAPGTTLVSIRETGLTAGFGNLAGDHSHRMMVSIIRGWMRMIT